MSLVLLLWMAHNLVVLIVIVIFAIYSACGRSVNCLLRLRCIVTAVGIHCYGFDVVLFCTLCSSSSDRKKPSRRKIGTT